MSNVPTFTSRPGTDTTASQLLVASHVEEGQPRVFLVIKKKVLKEALLDGEPAFVIALVESAPDKDNGAWQLGSLICDTWTEAEKRAGRR